MSHIKPPPWPSCGAHRLWNIRAPPYVARPERPTSRTPKYIRRAAHKHLMVLVSSTSRTPKHTPCTQTLDNCQRLRTGRGPAAKGAHTLTHCTPPCLAVSQFALINNAAGCELCCAYRAPGLSPRARLLGPARNCAMPSARRYVNILCLFEPLMMVHAYYFGLCSIVLTQILHAFVSRV